MGLSKRRCCPLSPVADGASELVEIVWNDRMLAVRLLGHIGQRGLF